MEVDLKKIIQPKTIKIKTKIKTMVVAPLRVTSFYLNFLIDLQFIPVAAIAIKPVAAKQQVSFS